GQAQATVPQARGPTLVAGCPQGHGSFTRAYEYAPRSGQFIGLRAASLDSSFDSIPSLGGGIHRPVPRSGQECGEGGSYVPVWLIGLSTAAHGSTPGAEGVL